MEERSGATDYVALARAVRAAYAHWLRGEAVVASVPESTGPPAREAEVFGAGFAAGVRYAEERAFRS